MRWFLCPLQTKAWEALVKIKLNTQVKKHFFFLVKGCKRRLGWRGETRGEWKKHVTNAGKSPHPDLYVINGDLSADSLPVPATVISRGNTQGPKTNMKLGAYLADPTQTRGYFCGGQECVLLCREATSHIQKILIFPLKGISFGW